MDDWGGGGGGAKGMLPPPPPPSSYWEGAWPPLAPPLPTAMSVLAYTSIIIRRAFRIYLTKTYFHVNYKL